MIAAQPSTRYSAHPATRVRSKAVSFRITPTMAPTQTTASTGRPHGAGSASRQIGVYVPAMSR